MHDFRKLKVWEKSHDLTVDIYLLTKGFPREEQFGLTSQLRKSGSSIAANIAEGCGRGSKPDFVRFLWIAMGSAFEVHQHILLAQALNYLSSVECGELESRIVEIKKMLTGLISKTSDREVRWKKTE